MTFKVIDRKTGKEPTSRVIDHIAKKGGLMDMDIDQFFMGEDGSLVLADDCGNITYCDTERFKVIAEQKPKTDTWSIEEVADALERHGLLEQEPQTDNRVKTELSEIKAELKQEPCEGCISRQAAIDAIRRIGMCKCSTNEIESIDECRRAVEALPFFTAEPKTEQEPEADGWHDSEKPPKNDKYVLLSFSNCTLPCVGRYYGTDEDGGNYYEGDKEKPLIQYGLFVNGWMELPKCRRD